MEEYRTLSNKAILFLTSSFFIIFMAMQQQQTQKEQPVQTDQTKQQSKTLPITEEDATLFYNIFTFVTANVDPQTNESAKQLVEACQKAATVIKQLGNVSEADAPQGPYTQS